MDPYESARLDQIMAEITTGFAEDSILVAIHEQVMTITASADGGIWSVIWIAIPSGFFGGFGQLWAADAYSAVKDSIRRIRKSRTGDLLVTDGAVRAIIESDLPEDAILQLADQLPEAPSGDIRYDRRAKKWVDSLQRNSEED